MMLNNSADLGGSESKRAFICHCSGTTQEQILDLIDDGADSLECLSRMTGASLGCGACESVIQDLLDERLKQG